MDYKGLRRHAGLSLMDMANRTGYSKSYIAKVESGEYNASTRFQEAFLRAINKIETPLEKQEPIIQVVHELGLKNARIKSIIAEVRPSLLKTKDLIELINACVELTDTIAQQQGSQSDDSPLDINLAEADAEVVHEAQEDIITNITNALKKWNFHKLPKDAQKASLKYLTDEVLARL